MGTGSPKASLEAAKNQALLHTSAVCLRVLKQESSQRWDRAKDALWVRVKKWDTSGPGTDQVVVSNFCKSGLEAALHALWYEGVQAKQLNSALLMVAGTGQSC